MSKKVKKKLEFFIPNEMYKKFSEKENFTYNGVKLKTAYIFSIMNDMLRKYYVNKNDTLTNETNSNLSSKILKKKYGQYYNYYMNYLQDYGYITMVSDYFNGEHGKARTYKVQSKHLIYIRRISISDSVLEKKMKKEYLKETYTKVTNSPIPLDIRERLVDDLYAIQMNFTDSLKLLDTQKDNKILSYNKFMKNLMSIENIKNGQIFFSFDKYGRMHTNYTSLKKEIRSTYVKIDNDDICEIDLVNSQPLFLTKLMNLEMTKKYLLKKDVSRYIGLAKQGLIYEEFVNVYDICRNEAKDILYRVLFGKSNLKNKDNKRFYKLFPTVYDFIAEYKKKYKEYNISAKEGYKILSWKLQNLESEFIFNNVVREIYDKIPNIKLFTVHDSICYPCKYNKEVKNIFTKHREKLLR